MASVFPLLFCFIDIYGVRLSNTLASMCLVLTVLVFLGSIGE